MQKKGKNIMLFLGFDGDTSCVALATNHTLNLTPQFDETKTKDDDEGPAPARVDYTDWDATIDSLVGSSATSGTKEYTDLIEAIISGTSILAVTDAVSAVQADGPIPTTGFTPANSTTVFPKLSGTGLLSELTIDAGETGNANMSAKVVGTSALS